MRAALIQLTSSDDPVENLTLTRDFLADAAMRGANFVSTPEVTNCVSLDRSRQGAVLNLEEQDPTLAALREDAARLGLWLHIGSLALKDAHSDRFVNRGFLVKPDGDVVARYDKIHMFDVQLSASETFSRIRCLSFRGSRRAGAYAVWYGRPYHLLRPAVSEALSRFGSGGS